MKGRPIPYSPDELAWVEANRTLPQAELKPTILAVAKLEHAARQGRKR